MQNVIANIEASTFTNREEATKESIKRNKAGNPTSISVHISKITGKRVYTLAPRENRWW